MTKNFINLILLSLILTITFILKTNANINQMQNQREALAFWQNENLIIQGKHRPYSKIKIFENNKFIEETWSESTGNFNFNLGKTLTPKKKHQITIHAYDNFDREILQEDEETPDIIKKIILPGLETKGIVKDKNGKPLKNTEIEIFDENGNLLNVVSSNENGYFFIKNISQNAKIKIKKEEKNKELNNQKSEIIFKGEKEVILQVDSDIISNEKSLKSKKNDHQQNSMNLDTSNNGWIFYIFLVVVLFGSTVIFYIFYEKYKKS